MTPPPPPAIQVPLSNTPPGPTPKAWWKKKWGIATIVVGVVLVVGAIGSMGGSTGGQPSQSPASSASPAADITASPAPSATDQPSAVPSTAAPAVSDPPATEAPATASPTPAPTATPAPTPVPPVLSAKGRGDKVVKFAAQDGPTIAKIKNTGGGNFAVISYSGSTYDDLLVNVIGSYAGTVYVNPSTNRLRITSSGSWSVTLLPVTSARKWGGTSALSGKGDDVVILSGAASGATTIKNKGRSNFAVIAHGIDGEYLDLLVNEIGSYSGEVLLPDADRIVLVVHATGGVWSMSTPQ